ncbi:MAG: acyl carrier protein [Pseudomonadota bacterium]
MTRNDIEPKIRSILARVTSHSVSDLSIHDDLIDATGIDSLGRLEVLSELEEAFDVTIYDLDSDKISTIRGIIDVVETAMLEPV